MNPAIEAPDADPVRTAPNARSARWPLVALSVPMLLSSLGTSIANVALPTLARELGASFGQAQWIVIAYLVAVTASVVGAGRLGDLTGRRRLLQTGLLIFTAASVVAALADTLWLLIVARTAQGLGAAAMMAISLAMVGEIVPKASTGRAMGLLGATSAIGTALGPSLGGALVDQLGGSAIFGVNVPLGAVAIALVHRTLPADRPTSERIAFDTTGTLLLAATLAAYALAMTLGRGHFGGLNLALLVVSAAGGALFALGQARSTAPLVRLSLLRDRAMRAAVLANLLVSTVLMATLVVGPFYLAGALGLDAAQLGLVMSIGPIVAAAGGVPAGRLVDRLGTARVTTVGLLAVAAGAGGLSLAPAALGVVGYAAPIVVLTWGYALFSAANNTAALRDLDPRERGVVSGTLNLSRNLGLVTGASVMGAVFALGSGTSDPTTSSAEALAAGMRVTFAVATVLVVTALAIITSARSRRTIAVAWTLAALLVPRVAAAQPPAVDEQALVLRSADGVNSLRLMGLFQLQVAHDRIDAAPDTAAFSVNRARLGLVGTVLRRDLRYTFVAEFADVTPRLVFANLDYTVVPNRFAIRVGQFKRPLSRAFLTPGSELSMIDRPATVGPRAFGDNADLGVMLHNGTTARFEYAAGLLDGAGPNVVPDRLHPLVALRVGYNTRGTKPYTQSDLDGGPARFGIAAAALVDFDADGDRRSFTTGLVDLTFMARGFGLTSAVYAGTRQIGRHWSNQRVATLGHHTEVGHVIAKRVEPVARYAMVMPAGRGRATHDVAGGLNVFLHGHALKWQTAVTARLGARDGRSTVDLRVASQLGFAF